MHSKAYGNALGWFSLSVVKVLSVTFLVVCLMQIASAATIIETGTIGAPGSPGTSQHPNGGDGQRGGGAAASLSSTQSSESVFTVIASGGNGGQGGNGNGLPPGNGGHGARGGSATASADLNRTTVGNVSVTVDARGGGGGFYGGAPQNSTSGTGGSGGAASASGSARTVGGSNATTIVSARGGQGNSSTAGAPPSGGGATVSNVYGESDSGDVRVTALAVSGTGGGGAANANGLNIGAGGHSQSVVVEDAVDGNTAGRLFLTQRAAAGGAGGGAPPGIAGDARSVLSRNIAAGLLNMNVVANGGRGADDTFGHGSSAGGDASTVALGANPSGDVVVTADSRAGVGGNQSSNNRFGGRPAHDGGHATATAYGESTNGTALVRSYATGGFGGHLTGPSGPLVSDVPGAGGNARAEADGYAMQSVTVEAIAAGGQSGTQQSGYVQAPTNDTKAGRAVAIASGESLGRTNVKAIAASDRGSNASPALAHAAGVGTSGLISAEAISGWRIGLNQINRTRVYVESNVPGQAEVGAAAFHDGFFDGMQTPPIAPRAGARAGSHFDNNVYDAAHFFAQAGPSANATQQIDMTLEIEYNDPTVLPFNPADDLLIDLTQISIVGGGFERLDFSAQHVQANRTVSVSLFDAASALNFFANPINLGPVGTSILGGGGVDIRMQFDISLSQPGQGIHVRGAGTVPLPGSIWMLLGAIGFTLRFANNHRSSRNSLENPL